MGGCVTEDVVRGQGTQLASHIRPGLIDYFSSFIFSLFAYMVFVFIQHRYIRNNKLDAMLS